MEDELFFLFRPPGDQEKTAGAFGYHPSEKIELYRQCFLVSCGFKGAILCKTDLTSVFQQ